MPFNIVGIIKQSINFDSTDSTSKKHLQLLQLGNSKSYTGKRFTSNPVKKFSPMAAVKWTHIR